MGRPAKFHEIQWHWARRDDDARSGYQHMDGTLTIQALLDHIAEIAPDVPLDQMQITYGCLRWERPGTPEEVAERRARAARDAERTEAWERKTLAELMAKYGVTTL